MGQPLKFRARQVALGAARVLERWGQDTAWAANRQPGEAGYERTWPTRFPDVDSLVLLCQQLSADGERTVTLHSGGMTEGHLPRMRAAAQGIAESSPQDRRSIHITVDAGEEVWARISFGLSRGRWTRQPQITTGNMGDLDLDRARSIAFLIDDHTRPYTRRELRRRVPLIEPIDMQGTTQRAHDLDVAQKAARTGGRWGAVTGALGGAAATGLVTWLSRGGS